MKLADRNREILSDIRAPHLKCGRGSFSGGEVLGSFVILTATGFFLSSLSSKGPEPSAPVGVKYQLYSLPVSECQFL